MMTWQHHAHLIAEAKRLVQLSSLLSFHLRLHSFIWSHSELEQGAKHAGQTLHVLVGWAFCPAGSQVPALAHRRGLRSARAAGPHLAAAAQLHWQTASWETACLRHSNQPQSAALTVPKMNLFFHYSGGNNSNYGNVYSSKKETFRQKNIGKRSRLHLVPWRRRYRRGG